MKKHVHGNSQQVGSLLDLKRPRAAVGILAVLVFLYIFDPVHRYLLSSAAETFVIFFFLPSLTTQPGFFSIEHEYLLRALREIYVMLSTVMFPPCW